MASRTTHRDGPPRRSDGEQTHAAILDAAMPLASIEGLFELANYLATLCRDPSLTDHGRAVVRATLDAAAPSDGTST